MHGGPQRAFKGPWGGPPEDPKVLIIVQNHFRGQSFNNLAFQINVLYLNKRVDNWVLKPFSVSSLYVRAESCVKRYLRERCEEVRVVKWS